MTSDILHLVKQRALARTLDYLDISKEFGLISEQQYFEEMKKLQVATGSIAALRKIKYWKTRWA